MSDQMIKETGIPMPDKDNWMKIEHDYHLVCEMSTVPDASFKRVKTGDIIDEEKSVRWNREEVWHLKSVYTEEIRRLRKEKALAYAKVVDRAVRLISNEAGISEEKARFLWDFVDERYHSSYRDMFMEMGDYILLAKELVKG